MGGFFRGIGAAASGVGAAIPAWREQQLNMFQQNKQAMMNLAQQQMNLSQDPVVRGQYGKLISDMAFATPGTKLAPIWSQMQKLGMGHFHPENEDYLAAMGTPTPQPPKTVPGIPAPANPMKGEVPGGKPADQLAPPAAQPSTNIGQAGGQGIQIPPVTPSGLPMPPPPEAAGNDLTAGLAAKQPGDLSALSAVPPAVAPMAAAPAQPTPSPAPQGFPPVQPFQVAEPPELALYRKIVASGAPVPPGVTAAAVPYLEAQAKTQAELQQKQQMDQYLLNVLGPQQYNRIVQSMGGPAEYAKAPIGLRLEVAARTANIPINLPGAIFGQQLESRSTPMASLPPDTPLENTGGMTAGLYEGKNPGSQVREMYDRMSGRTLYFPITAQLNSVDLPGGGVGLINRQAVVAGAPSGGATPVPVQGAVAPSNAAVKQWNVVGNNGIPGVILGTPSQMQTGGLTGRLFNPGMSTSEQSTSQTKDFAGNTQTVRQARKVPPVAAQNITTAPGIAAPGGAPVLAPPGAATFPTTRSLPTPVKAFNPADPVDKAAMDIADDAANWKEVTNTQMKAAVNQRMADLGLSPGNLTGSIRERAQNAQNILIHLGEIKGILKQADADGDIGIVASRWNDWLSGKLGSDPTKGQIFSKLASNKQFLESAVAMAHGGLRAASSPTTLEHWQLALEAKDAPTLLSKLGVAEQWMNTYAQMTRQGINRLQQEGKLKPESPSGTIPPPPGTTGNPALDSIINEYKKK